MISLIKKLYPDGCLLNVARYYLHFLSMRFDNQIQNSPSIALNHRYMQTEAQGTFKATPIVKGLNELTKFSVIQRLHCNRKSQPI